MSARADEGRAPLRAAQLSNDLDAVVADRHPGPHGGRGFVRTDGRLTRPGKDHRASWLDVVRGTRRGGLVLGTPATTFARLDMVACLVGILAGAAAERTCHRRASRPA